ncbi:MAG TPA: 4-(cytidine 5'-diphospho)-2-C-methyl-D-erythritol kinase [Candidatus Baltobacteraceae bacterium]|jgi:4-diphosphocytidyl-2-C-methyl-D-erythritol kinase|nr:4-(cytidine 5'-diphospho)-2-C-methyl-D-erythritol kinase [Candidatus Baltobacteraceae bacterium]
MKVSQLLRAPAKLNLTLEVLSRREDGLHALRSVMVPVDRYDEIVIEPAPAFRFTCDPAELSENNLAVRALDALGLSGAPMRMALRKHIPTGAGMGGGSSDAAAVLLAAQNGVFGPVDAVDYLQTARALGSDVPFFLVQTAALVEGTGERVTALGAVPAWHALVIKPPAAVETASAYRRIDAARRESRPRSDSVSLQVAQALQRGEFDIVERLLQNDFQDVLVPQVPEIAQALDRLREAGARHPVLTGSGSCVFAVFQDKIAAGACADRLALPAGYTAFTCGFVSGQPWRHAA